MKILNFALGVRFDILEGEDGRITPEQLWQEVFSALTTSDVGGMHVYGGMVMPHPAQDPCYVCAFTNGSLKEMRNVYAKLNADAGVCMYMTAANPFMQSNALAKVEGLTFFGKVQRDGTLVGGEPPFALRVCKKRGKRRPAGKGIVFLMAPGAYGGTLSSKQVIRRLTIAARKHFTGVRILPLPLADGGPGTVDALMMFTNGLCRAMRMQGPNGVQTEAFYAVLRGSVAVIETPRAYTQTPGHHSSYGIGELICRALNEGLSEIIVSDVDSGIDDCGMGCMRALGVKLLDAEGSELKGDSSDIDKLEKIDMELLHPRAKEVTFRMITRDESLMRGTHALVSGLLALKDNKANSAMEQEEYLSRALKLVQACLAQHPDVGKGIGVALCAFLGASVQSAIETLLDAAVFDSWMRHVSLVITGGLGGGGEQADMIETIMRRSWRHGVPVISVFGTGQGYVETEDKGDLFAALPTLHDDYISAEAAIETLDHLADSAFRLIKLGREIERVSVRKGE